MGNVQKMSKSIQSTNVECQLVLLCNVNPQYNLKPQELYRFCKHLINCKLHFCCCVSGGQVSCLIDHLWNKLLFVFKSQLNSLNSSLPCPSPLSTAEFSFYLACCYDSRYISLVTEEGRNHRSSGMTEVLVFAELQNHPGLTLSVQQHHLSSSLHLALQSLWRKYSPYLLQ